MTEPAAWEWTDAWLLVAVGWSSSPALSDVVEAADAINRATPTFAEAGAALARLAAAALVESAGAGWRLSAAGRAVVRAEPGRAVMSLDHAKDALERLPVPVAAPDVLQQDAYEAALARYHGRPV